MKSVGKTKLTLAFGFMAFLVYTFFKIITPSMPIPITKEKVLSPTRQTLENYLSMLENASLRNNGELTCDIKTAELFKFEDQWQKPIHCKTENGVLILSSDGEDKTSNTDDDIILSKANK
ncbi:MAG: hypothetical protein H7318_19020 [Oligoflexus sp.]|nr:hypothetical protein [Oligoflexus sp.]